MLTHEVASRSSGVRISRAISIDGKTDCVAARQQGMMFAVGLGFSPSEATIVATAMSELAGTILGRAARGQIILSAMSHSVPPALTATGLGEGEAMAGAAGVERFMDSFEIVSEVGPGLVATTGKPHDESRSISRFDDGG